MREQYKSYLWDKQGWLSDEQIDRTAQSLRFLKQYLYENAGSAYPDVLIEKPVWNK